jgi:hypothetical protein
MSARQWLQGAIWPDFFLSSVSLSPSFQSDLLLLSLLPHSSHCCSHTIILPPEGVHACSSLWLEYFSSFPCFLFSPLLSLLKYHLIRDVSQYKNSNSVPLSHTFFLNSIYHLTSVYVFIALPSPVQCELYKDRHFIFLTPASPTTRTMPVT